MSLALEGQSLTFANSGDMRLILKGFAPTVLNTTGHLTLPSVGSLAFTGNAVQLTNKVIVPATGSLALKGNGIQGDEDPVREPTLGSLAFSSTAPTRILNEILDPGVGSVSFNGQLPIRAFGLQAIGELPTAEIAHNRSTSLGSALVSSDAPQILVEDPSSNTIRVPPTVALSVIGQSETISAPIGPVLIGSVGVTGNAPSVQITAPGAPTTVALSISSTAPRVDHDQPPVLLFGIKAEFGTPIQNLDAVTDVPVNYEICDRSGFKVKPYKNPLVQDPYGNMVRAESSDKTRHPQERVKSTSEDYRTGAIRPEPIGDETFIDDDDPITADDL